MNQKAVLKGDCECCIEFTNVELFPVTGGMLACKRCKELSDAITTATKTVEVARKIDSAIELKQDIFNAETVSFAEIRAAIQNNPSIPDDQKEYAYVAECARRIDAISEVIFADEQALIAKRNQRYAWIVETQQAVARLRTEEQAKFKQYDVNFKPPTPKSIKTTEPTKRAPNVKTAELMAIAEKYGVPAAAVKAGMLAFKISAEESAKRLRNS